MVFIVKEVGTVRWSGSLLKVGSIEVKGVGRTVTIGKGLFRRESV